MFYPQQQEHSKVMKERKLRAKVMFTALIFEKKSKSKQNHKSFSDGFPRKI